MLGRHSESILLNWDLFLNHLSRSVRYDISIWHAFETCLFHRAIFFVLNGVCFCLLLSSLHFKLFLQLLQLLNFDIWTILHLDDLLGNIGVLGLRDLKGLLVLISSVRFDWTIEVMITDYGAFKPPLGCDTTL